MSGRLDWLDRLYPVEVECTFCGRLLTIKRRTPTSSTTSTHGHAPDCCQLAR